MRRPTSVVICGGGLAGLTLAKQLRVEVPEARVSVLEATPEPFPEAAHKVGESSVELGAHYFTQTLGLAQYIQERHLPKFGLRYFLGRGTADLAERLEFGPQHFPRVPSLQLDRGRLENDLRDMVRANGVDVQSDVRVRKIELGQGEAQHEVMFDGARSGSVSADWVVDASGRRRLLQSQLRHSLPSGHEASSAWWRVTGIRKVNDMLGAVGRRQWQSRLQDKRWLSTNHMMGRGYWVWFIPLGSGNTSIGIVTDETIHPLSTYNSHEKALGWLKQYEPAVFNFIEHDVPLDFKALRRYSYWSERVFSEDRWTCVGEAGAFLDPFYSPGSDFIGWSNTFTCDLVKSWAEGRLDKQRVEQFNRTYLHDLWTPQLAYYKDMYQVFGSPKVVVAKVHWDTCVYWAFPCQLYFQGHLDQEMLAEYGKIASKLIPLNARVQALFRQWAVAERGTPPAGGRFIPYSSMPMFRQLHQDLERKKSREVLLSEMWQFLSRFEEWAQVLFRVAAEDSGIASQLPGFGQDLWVNPLAIGLEPSLWREEGLFNVEGDSRSLEEMASQTNFHIFRPLQAEV